jgi:hypothetical protein
MQFFNCVILYLFLCIKYSSSSYIQCTSHCSKLTVSFLKPLTIPPECQENQNNINIYDTALVCLIDYSIDYDAKNIYITFKATNDTNMINKQQNQSEYLIQIVSLGFNQESGESNITHRTYGCNTKPDCARQFYLHTIERLITNGKSKLDKITYNLYNQSVPINKSTRRRCKDSSKVGNDSLVRCRTGLCYAHTIDKKQYCTSDKTLTLFSEFEYHLPKSVNNEREAIKYTCNRDLCNRNGMIDIIRNILYDYTNWNNRYTIEQPIEIKSSSTIRQIVSYYLIFVSLINLQFLF